MRTYVDDLRAALAYLGSRPTIGVAWEWMHAELRAAGK
jgi:hypothetical protein